MSTIPALILSIGLPLVIIVVMAILMARAKQPGVLTALLYILTLINCAVIYLAVLPKEGKSVWAALRQGGPLVAVLIGLMIVLFTYIIERYMTLRIARGTEPHQTFIAKFRQAVLKRDFDGAMRICDQQNGVTANILKSGLETYVAQSKEKASRERKFAALDKAITDATGRETPLLERNMIVLTTIASIGTMVGLLGTTIGMIRAFQAMGNTGAVDATKLAIGISEALFNTAFGLINAILGIVAHNYYVNKVDQFNYEIDSSALDMKESLTEIEMNAGCADASA
ncbi:MAG: MotA/TolQ/ExbB proton channel family protein [candidate division WOR-3 bacterium]